jgi:hypothetical protein
VVGGGSCGRCCKWGLFFCISVRCVWSRLVVVYGVVVEVYGVFFFCSSVRVYGVVVEVGVDLYSNVVFDITTSRTISIRLFFL